MVSILDRHGWSGDSEIDIQAGKNAGCKTARVLFTAKRNLPPTKMLRMATVLR